MTAEQFAAAVTVEELDRDPYPVYARLRAEVPVCIVPAVGLWFVTRWADVEHAATDPAGFAARVDPSPLERRETLVALARAGGSWYAVEAWCTHAECPLTDGWVEGHAIRCPCHGSLFDLATRAALEGPADEPVRTFPTHCRE